MTTSSLSSNDKRMGIIALTWPLFIEIMLRTAINTSDVFMLSSYSDEAVSAVGVITTFSFFLIIISSMISSGTGILVAQYNGAGKYQDSAFVSVASIRLSFIFGALLSLFTIFASIYLLPYYGLDKGVLNYAQQYFIITGGMTFNITIGIVLTTILRSHGHSKAPMLINLFAGVINITGNYIALYQPFGLPVFGVQGVAVATVAGQLISTLMLWFKIRRSGIDLPFDQASQIPRAIYKKVLKLGGMNAGEVLSYNIAQMAITYFVVQMGTSSVAAYTYAQNLARISFAFSLALGQASQIQTGYYIGKGWIEAIHKKVQIYFLVGFIISISAASGIYLFKDTLLPLFTTDPEILLLAGGLVAGSIILEAGRTFNLVFISALKAAGDVKFPVMMGILSMWGVSVVLSYFLGLHLAWGVIGAWIAIACDEWIRGIMMALRWRSKQWVKFKL
ncbi:MATE family efflux transporter [Vibrio sp.]|nr:MATE family efflux transporter [Vibrio sp.]